MSNIGNNNNTAKRKAPPAPAQNTTYLMCNVRQRHEQQEKKMVQAYNNHNLLPLTQNTHNFLNSRASSPLTISTIDSLEILDGIESFEQNFTSLAQNISSPLNSRLSSPLTISTSMIDNYQNFCDTQQKSPPIEIFLKTTTVQPQEIYAGLPHYLANRETEYLLIIGNEFKEPYNNIANTAIPHNDLIPFPSIEDIMRRTVHFDKTIIDTQTPVQQNDKIIYLGRGNGQQNKQKNREFQDFIDNYKTLYCSFKLNKDKINFKKGSFVYLTEHGYKFCKANKEEGQEIYKQIDKIQSVHKILAALTYKIRKEREKTSSINQIKICGN